MNDSSREQVTRILSRIGSGAEDPAALMPVVYEHLRSMADQFMRSERGSHTLQPTALVHEAFVRLMEGQGDLGSSRAEFLAVAGRAMRNLLIDHARRRKAGKRGGGEGERVTLSGLGEAEADLSDQELLDLHEALTELEQLDERQARIVEMAYFAGMTGDEMAQKLGVHRNSVVRDLQMARAWLRRRLASKDSEGP